MTDKIRWNYSDKLILILILIISKVLIFRTLLPKGAVPQANLRQSMDCFITTLIIYVLILIQDLQNNQRLLAIFRSFVSFIKVVIQRRILKIIEIVRGAQNLM